MHLRITHFANFAPVFMSLCFAVGCNASDDGVLLRLQPEVGTHFATNLSMAQKTESVMMGQTMPTDQEMRLTFDFDVREMLAPSSYLIGCEYTRIVMKATAGGATNVFDSETASQTTAPLGLGSSALVGTNFSVVLDSRSKVEEVRGGDQVFDTMSTTLQAQLGEEAGLIPEGTWKMLGPEAVADVMRVGTIPFPEEHVKLGSTWKQSMTLQSPFPMHIDMKYTLRDVTPTVARIDLHGTTSPIEGGGQMRMGEGIVVVEMTGTQNGTAEVLLSDGMLNSFSVDQEMTGDMSVDPGNGEAIQATIKVDNHVTMQMERE